MIADLKPYPEYRESGLPWLAPVPVHWSITRIKTVLRELDCRSVDGNGTLLSLTRLRGLIPHTDRTDKVHGAKTLVGYKRYQPDQIVMNRMQAWSGMFGASPISGLVSPDYAVFEVLGGHQTKLVLERLKTPDLVGQFALESKGIGSGFNRLYTDRFGPIPITLPPPAEQAAIARFLDYANGRLEKAIRAKRKLIVLLNEQKQAIIHRAVTRGLDPKVRLKDSGMPWLGEIPEHWEVRKLGRVARVFNGATPSRAQPKYWLNGTVAWLASGKVNEGVVREPSQWITAEAARDCSLRIAPRGALILGMIGQGKTRGTSALLDIDACINQNLAAIVPGRGVNSLFIHYVFVTCYPYIRELGRGGNQEAMNCEMVAALRMPIPPHDEQLQIVESCVGRLSCLERPIAEAEIETALLREYRTRLIADVVTGKLDVREAARNLPDEAEELNGSAAVDANEETLAALDGSLEE